MQMSKEELKILYAKFDNDVAKRTRIMRLLLVTDQLFNVLLWNGSQDETISSHINKKQVNGTANWLDNFVCSILNKLESSHCFKSRGE